ncbi:molybdenum cofactor guanylyltransferase [Halobiforma haloterrestris]|uniref:Probable molybdenum cofactor guanylyltransferase n=1 Tax=Natronobacterium haloterrestre TaxID=148448 RepID=A0A1I1ILS7_NATHA|nr:molybdenum cofactor guanylyltransferase [Halobiforma haloterrestris]SFC36652.1 molybdenum cofactor guanylyltransferase [Halobiforma haloterrestris]
MPTNQTLAGVVIAGGYSTRFGDADKAVADLAGTPMIRRVVDRLATVTDEIVVNCREDQLEAIDAALEGCDASVRFATDPVEDRGPLAGIRVGLETATREYAAVVACDMPFVDPALLELLLERAQGSDGAVVRLEDGWYQTTQAVYRTDAMAEACAAALEGDDGRILAAIDRIDCVTVAESELEAAGVDDATFESVDTQAELEDAADRLG